MFPLFVSAVRAAACTGLALLLLLPAAVAAQAEFTDDADVALELHHAAQLAVQRQPLLLRLQAQARAARESAIAAQQLPDPQLYGGISDLPINTDDAGSLSRDSDTQLVVGLMQEFPRATKRRLRGELDTRAAEGLDAGHALMRRSVQRDAALAWLDLWRYDQALMLTRASLREAGTQQQAIEILLRSGSASQADVLAARVETSRLQDAAAGMAQNIQHARNALSRWIGGAAQRLVCPELPSAELPPLETLLTRVRTHPQLKLLAAEVAAAKTGSELAQAEYAPDWRVELGYAERPAFSEMVTLQVGIDLPLFRRQRQDRGLAAALAQQDAAAHAVADGLRQLEADARLNHHDAERLAARLAFYAQTLLPQTEQRIEAARAAWGAGRGALAQVLDARRSALDAQMTRLELQHDAAKHYVQLTYLGAYDAVAVDQQHE